MGLDTSHNEWHGAYSAFMTWRKKIAEVAGMPPLELMEGFYDPIPPNSRHLPTLYRGLGSESDYPYGLQSLDERLPIKWDCLKPSALHSLLSHSDCDGEIYWKECNGIADELERLLPSFPDEDAGGHIGHWKTKTEQFIAGLREAFDKKENLEFH